MPFRKFLVNTFKSLVLASALFVTMIIVSGIAVPVESPAENASQTMLLLFIVNFVNAVLISLVVTQTRWSGWPLVLGLTAAFYGVQTVIGQIEAVVFLTPLGEHWGAGSIPVLTMPLDFISGQLIVGAAVAVIGIPLSALLFGKIKRSTQRPLASLFPKMGRQQWLLKMSVIIVLYVLLYFGFGYYVAWKNPAVQTFYQGVDPGSFAAQMRNVIRETPTLVPFQGFRALLWTAFTFPLISMLRKKGWLGALLTGLFVSLPMNIPHIIPNPYMPPDVRLVHFIETASSTFIFGLLLYWLLHRKHHSLQDLFGLSKASSPGVISKKVTPREK